LKEKLKAIDFFCGAGGVTCGFKQAGIEVLGGIDIDEKCKDTYEKNNLAKFLNVDISKLEKKELSRFFKIKKNQDDLIFVGCSPCQYYSKIQTNKTKAEKTRLLLSDFQEFVDYYNPGFIFIENVPGLDKKEGSPLSNFKEFLEEKGYVFDDKVVNAKYYGVPQNRSRYILVASRIREKISIPAEDRKNIKTVKHVIGNYKVFPAIDAGHKDKTEFIHSSAALTQKNIERIRKTPKNGGDRRAWKDTELQLDCYKKHNGHTDFYGRMTWDKPSPAITTRFVSFSNGRYGHPEQDRAISLREGATLQSFPLDYNFYSDSQGAIAKMIGNAVPPELARIVGNIIKGF
jgi:DNA (cytosine-5)-methyltransferase 1